MLEKLKQIISELMSGNIKCVTPDNIMLVSNEAMRLLNKEHLDEDDVACMNLIITISQIVYNNTDRSILFITDGVYDLLLEKDKKYNTNYQVGAPVVNFNQDGEAVINQEKIYPVAFMPEYGAFKRDSLFADDICKMPSTYDINFFSRHIDRNSGRIVSKRNIGVPHMYPKLVGSLDKCKFVLDKDAIEMGVFNDPNVKVFERDFLRKHLEMGLIDMTTPFEMIAELKYDGVSVEADVTNKILSARSRGDANNDIAADLSDIFDGFEFPYAPKMNDSEAFGMKFEAIITHLNLEKMSKLRGKYYKNSRNGIIGLLGSSDAYDYRDLITLVPLATSIEDIDRVTEIEFLNKYYQSGVYLAYSILRGTYTEILYQVYRFTQEAEALRDYMPFMYDGVVISYRDPKIIKALGRENSINKYSMAIKFNPKVCETIFTGYTYTVGQDGIITPMIHYAPVEFFGTVHSKSSGHSYKRFMDLQLAIGDPIQVQYTNDVMPYVTKLPVQDNGITRIPVQFPTNCPYCGAPIIITESGKSAFCPNKDCPERVISRMSNMMAKLNLKDFGSETFRFLGTKSLSQLFNYTFEDVKALGPISGEKLLQRINELRTTPTYDYKLIGSLGFSGIAIETWRKILNEIPLSDLLSLDDESLFLKLVSIKGIGDKTSRTIVEERHILSDDINCIVTQTNIIPSFGVKQGKIIRFTGCRPDDNLYAYLTSKGCDARGDAGVTKNTDILVVPYMGFTSSKTSKVGPNTMIVDMAAFQHDPDVYLNRV